MLGVGMTFLVYAYAPIPRSFLAVIVVVLVLIVIGRYLHDRRTGDARPRASESTLEWLTRRNKIATGYLIVLVAIVVLVFLIATAQVPCSQPTRLSNPVACK
jgi:uncharacterized membrane protein